MNVPTARTSCAARPLNALSATHKGYYNTYRSTASLRMATVARAGPGDASAPTSFDKEAFDAERLKLDEQVTATAPATGIMLPPRQGSELFLQYLQQALD